MSEVEKLVAEKQKQLDADLRAFVATPQGRRVFWRLLLRSGIDRSSFSESALSTAFNEGKRAFGIELGAEVQRLAPDAYVTAMREHLDTAAIDAAALAAAKKRDEEA